jgi:hypothetical protein
MDLHPKDERALTKAVEDLRQMHGDALLAVVLYGEASGPGYRPRKSPLALVVLLEQVSPEALRATRTRVGAWRRRRIPTPMLMDPLYIESSLDVFPLEFLEIGDQHRVLHGQSDPFADLAIDVAHLRLEVEEQIRGKMLHLWEAYLEAGRSKRTLKRLLTETPPGFEVILRGMLKLREEALPPDAGAGPAGARPDHPEALLASVEEEFGIELPTLRRLEAVRQDRDRLQRGELEDVFEAYLTEVRRLGRIVDGL